MKTLNIKYKINHLKKEETKVRIRMLLDQIEREKDKSEIYKLHQELQDAGVELREMESQLYEN